MINFSHKLWIARITMLLGVLVVGYVSAQTIPAPNKLAGLSEGEFRKVINDKLGYQGYVSVTQKPTARCERNPNPYVNPTCANRPDNLWYLYWIEVGTNQAGGKVNMAEGKTWDEVLYMLKSKYPNMFGN